MGRQNSRQSMKQEQHQKVRAAPPNTWRCMAFICRLSRPICPYVHAYPHHDVVCRLPDHVRALPNIEDSRRQQKTAEEQKGNQSAPNARVKGGDSGRVVAVFGILLFASWKGLQWALGG
jgi:hypothetical protein